MITTGFTGVRDGVEFPHLAARPHIEGADVATRTGRTIFAGTAAGDEQIFVDGHRIGNCEARAAAFTNHFGGDADIGIDLPAPAKARRQPAGGDIHRHDQAAIGGKDDARRGFRVAGPIGNAAAVDIQGTVVFPDQLAGFRAQRRDRRLQVG